jgi:hypothetical protein
VGIRCDETLLGHIAEIEPRPVRQRLPSFIEAGLLIRGPRGYAFLHDRVLESACLLIDVAQRPRGLPAS